VLTENIPSITLAVMDMRKWMLWVLTVVMLIAAYVFLMWAIQTAWLGSFPNKDKEKYAVWAAWQLAGAVVSLLIPAVLWFVHRRKNRSGP
jgi:methionine sulfoxide reductase heme-binding subunit